MSNIHILGKNGKPMKKTPPSEIPIEQLIAFLNDPKREGDITEQEVISVCMFELSRAKHHLLKYMSESKTVIESLEARIAKLEQS